MIPRLRRLALTPAILISISAAACGEGAARRSELGHASQAISGTDDPDSESSLPIVNLSFKHDRNPSTEEQCSGTFVTPRIILTAAHCMLSTANPDNVVFPLQGMGKATRIEKQGAGEIADTDAALVFVSADVNLETNPRLHSKISHPWLTVPTQYSPFVLSLIHI